MTDLVTSEIGRLNQNTAIATSDQLVTYSNNIISADSVSFGGNDSTHKNLTDRVSGKSIAIGYNTEATNSTASIAIGAYAKATGNGSVQINGAADGTTTNNDANTLKFYTGSSNGNTTVVGTDGKIPVGSLNYGTSTLTFTYSDTTTKKFSFVCKEVTA